MNRRLLVVALFLVHLSGCERHTPAPASTDRVSVAIGSKTYRLEIADSDSKRSMGMMFRNSLPEDEGILFIFPDEAPRKFWMKNVKVPLDILYLDSAGKIVTILPMPVDPPNATDNNHPSYPSTAPAMYVIELNLGHADKAGVKVGDVIALPASILQR